MKVSFNRSRRAMILSRAAFIFYRQSAEVYKNCGAETQNQNKESKRGAANAAGYCK